MQSLHIRFCRAETRSRKTKTRKTKTRSKRTKNIWFFRILIDSILWQILVRSEKLEFAFFASMHVRRIRCITFFIDFSIIFNFWHCIDISNELSTVKSHEYSIIDVAKNIWKFWNSQWCYQDHDVIRTFVNIALFKQLILVSWCIFYSILDIRFHIDASINEKAHSKRRTFSDNRSIARSHVLQIDFTSYLKSINHRILIRSFLQSSHRYMTRHWKSLLESFKQCIVEKTLEITSLKELHRWKNLHENFKSDWIR